MNNFDTILLLEQPAHFENNKVLKDTFNLTLILSTYHQGQPHNIINLPINTFSRRSTPQGSLQPPPAHQHRTSTLGMSMSSMPFDFSSKYQPSMTPKTIGQTTLIPGTSSTLTPIDLSSG